MVDISQPHREFQRNSERELEKYVGISVYSSSHLKGVGGIYKYSYKDFIVKEINGEGKIFEIKEDVPISIYDESSHKYTTFNLIKINRDTFETVRILSRLLDVSVDSIHYCGLKDKLSLSVQQFSIRGNYVNKLKKFRYKDVFVRNITPTKKPVKIGSNWGNNFNITIRNIDPGQKKLETIQEILKILHKYGFPNYYGLQRFGTFRPNSHLVGRYILEEKYKDAFEEMVLTTYSTEDLKSQKIREKLRKTRDYGNLMKKIPNSLNYEKMLLKSIIDHPHNYERAIKKLPSYLLRLLISSFQSYLFNKLITLRVKNGFSLFQPVSGDVIGILDEENGHLTKVKYLYGRTYDKYLDEAISLDRARIVIPLIGYDTNTDEFPLFNQLLRDLLIEEDIKPSIFENSLLREFDFKGAYRSMMVKPVGLELLDFGKDDVFKNKNKLKLEYSLKKGSYATMLLRELIK